MATSRRRFIQQGAAGLAVGSTVARSAAFAANGTGIFKPNWDSLTAQYQAPEWFRDAKLGIWAHWSAQCVPERGDWYARKMYLQGDPIYDHHVKTYGHPTNFGFMEIENLWKAEHWEPEALMDLYVRAGAKYFVSLANHHDNFDTYNSRHHAWNAVNIGPKKDIVGTWARAARARGLKFGVSNHSAHAWHWYQVAYGYDPEGPLAGKRYDAFTLTKTDGRGKWWEGLDPQDLYTGRNFVPPEGIPSIRAMDEWHEKNDRVWTEKPPANNPAFVRKWTLRCRDLIDQHKPDLIYFDNEGLPLGQAGLDMAAYYYNSSMGWNGGKLDVVINGKRLPEEHRKGVVEDVERGFNAVIQPNVWQTDTCIGGWHYDRALFEQHRYMSTDKVIHRLCDIVSKNGNLLLSIPLRGDGTIDDDEHKVLDGMAEWMRVNGEAIYGTRPWKVFGEGPTEVKAGMFGEGKVQPFTARDVRFTTKAGELYAILLGWPDNGEAKIVSLAEGSPHAPGRIEKVSLLGSTASLKFDRNREALTVKLPERAPGEYAFALKISGLSG
jgi:alpha-L-fucosidase